MTHAVKDCLKYVAIEGSSVQEFIYTVFRLVTIAFYCFRASNPNITAWMEKMGYGQNYSLLEQHYEQK